MSVSRPQGSDLDRCSVAQGLDPDPSKAGEKRLCGQ